MPGIEIPTESLLDAHERGKRDGLKQAAQWLRRQASAEKEPKAKAAFTEAHNAILALAEGRT